MDATPLLLTRTGVGEFCLRSMQALAERPDIDVSAFALTWRGWRDLAGLVPRGVKVAGRPVPARALRAAWSHSSLPPSEALIGRFDVVHGTNYVAPPSRSAATVATVYDLTVLHLPEMCEPASLAFPHLVRRAVRAGAWVHTPSQFVAEEVVSLLGVPPERVRTVALGVTAPGTGGTAVSSATSLPGWVGSYVLALGTVEPRKGLPGLVRAFSRIASDHPATALVLAGPDGWGTAELAAALAGSPARDQVLRLGWVSDDQRDALLAGAAALAYPSLYEGFGLPPLQAMAAGTPVVATRAGALEEVLGDAALLVEVGDEDALAQALEAVLSDVALGRGLAERGRRHAARYSWEACGDGLAQLYRDAAAGTP